MATKKSKKRPESKNASNVQTARKTRGKSSLPAADESPVNVRSETSKVSATRPSALNAAALVLAESAEPMNCQEMIAVMAQKGLWTSPAGKTPAATLYSGILKEIRTKGALSRFQKMSRGKFAPT